MGQTLEAVDRSGIGKKITIEEKNPYYTVKVTKAGKNGIRVAIDKTLSCLEGEKYFYLMDREHIYRCDEEFGGAIRVFVQEMLKSQGGRNEIEINERDIPLFYERVLEKVGCYWNIAAEDVSLEDYRPQELKARLWLSFCWKRKYLEISWLIRNSPGTSLQTVRGTFSSSTG